MKVFLYLYNNFAIIYLEKGVFFKIMKKVIEVLNLTKEYKTKKAIDDLSFNVYEGEILGLLESSYLL